MLGIVFGLVLGLHLVVREGEIERSGHVERIQIRIRFAFKVTCRGRIW